MGSVGKLHMLYTCPFCWKVRSLLEHLGLEYEAVQVNPMKSKKLPSAPEWKKVPVWVDSSENIHVDSTPIMKQIDSAHNAGQLWEDDDEKRRDKWMNWVDTKLSKATIPILYGSITSALTTTRRVSKLEKFGFFSKKIYAWAGFPIMWGIIARKRTKNTGMNPKQLWHHLLDQWTNEMGEKPFFGGEKPDLVDLIVYGYMQSVEMHQKAFRHIEDHEAGMVWFRRMKGATA